jgi:hypothetical protein
MNISERISGIAKVEGVYKNIILNPGNFSDESVKEIIYSTEFGEIEVFFGFSDLDIAEVDDNSSEVHNARVFLRDNPHAQGIVFLKEGFLVITDLTFFSAYTRIGGKEAPYTSLVESDSYEDEVAANLIEEDMRLQ